MSSETVTEPVVTVASKAAKNIPYDARLWLRHSKKFPHLWCPGCGLGIILGSSIRAFHDAGFEKDTTVVVAGIGCTGRMPVYMDCNTLHTTHGRALTFATGVKLAKPHLDVVVYMGDGDALAIGGNHFIHSARRNLNLTAIVVNNSIYGMTGGQVSPTTPHGARSTTTPRGQFARPFDTCDLAIGAGATFVARTSITNARHMQKMIHQGLKHDGFSMIEIVSNCHTSFGRLNGIPSHLDMFQQLKERTVLVKPDMDMEEEKSEGRLPLGVLHCDTTVPNYLRQKLGDVAPKPAKATGREP
ncbi:MAG: 2-oxoacid:ferredoxin oxidoreductase subunit beta [Lentisphaerae bacterium]|nr:2-oxoacid:ferredoxin oxidoreductase subunit beta [Lentisphaerota bacterium]